MHRDEIVEGLEEKDGEALLTAWGRSRAGGRGEVKPTCSWIVVLVAQPCGYTTDH